MGGGKRNKHKNRYKNKANKSLEVNECETPCASTESAEAVGGFDVIDLTTSPSNPSLGNKSTSEIEVMCVDNFHEESTDVSSKWDDESSLEVTKDTESSAITDSDVKNDSETNNSNVSENAGRPMVSERNFKQPYGRYSRWSAPDDGKCNFDNSKYSRNKFGSTSAYRNDRPEGRSRRSEPSNYNERGFDRKNDRESNTWASFSSKKQDYHRNKSSYEGKQFQRSSSRDGGYRSNSKQRDSGFLDWEQMYANIKEQSFTNVNEEFGDLFCVSDEYALGHCVAEDMNMGSGIATQFRSKFKHVDELLEQRVTQGGVATLYDGKRYIYYLVTKRVSSGKPTYETLYRSLSRMKRHVMENNVKKIALPRIGCGLDGLEWTCVKSMLQYIFENVNVEIVVYNYQQGYQESTPPMTVKKKCPVVNVLKSIVEIEQYTIILYPCCLKFHVSKEMEELDKTFNIVKAYQNAKRELGTVIRTECRNTFIIYGVVVHKTSEDLLSYMHFQKCIAEIHKLNRKDQYEFVAIEGFKEHRDTLIVSKLVNLMRNTFYNVYVYVCWPKHLEHLAPRDIDYS